MHVFQAFLSVPMPENRGGLWFTSTDRQQRNTLPPCYVAFLLFHQMPSSLCSVSRSGFQKKPSFFTNSDSKTDVLYQEHQVLA